MIDPYAVPLMGPCRYLDEEGRQHSFSLSNARRRGAKRTEIRDKFVLKPNSICYVTLEPYFRIPSYIAGRFNLLINNVYRGLLVGTGPLVDPGFSGNLSIPIHNFTTNSYQFQAGEDFVYFEFTKLSWSNHTDPPSSLHWVPKVVNDQPPFPASKGKRRSVDDYLANATGRGPAQSAIGEEIRKITETSKTTENRLQLFSIAAAASVGALIITALALAFASYDVFSSARRFVDDVALRQDGGNTQLQERVDDAVTLISRLDQSDGNLMRQIDEIRSELRRELVSEEVVSNQISELRSELSRLKADVEKFVSSGTDAGDRTPTDTE